MTSTTVQPQEAQTLQQRVLRQMRSGLGPLIAALALICIALSLASPEFLTTSTLTNIMVQVSVVGIAAVGGTFVIITSGIDLSVGSLVALSGMVAATVMAGASPDAIGLGVAGLFFALATGAAVGALNGFGIAWLRLVPFIVTLAMMAMGRGLTLAISDGRTKFDFPTVFTAFGAKTVAGLPAPMLVMLAVFVIGHVLLRKTEFGHQVFAVGGNKEAARLAGIPVNRVIFFTYMLAGVTAAIAGIVLAGRLNSALPSAANGLELQVIAGIVIGGTSLAGGRGSIVGTFIGVVLIGVINVGLSLLGVNPFWTQFIQGGVILAAVLLDALSQRRKH
ncbi:ABC transporter permease [Paraburkholderia unamae]|uniref:Ribose transport system permease protein/putative xylitol transport system permease protein n=1 Tax=Paraburkholderia unamae TaxID=219649 RepID=A0ABX5KUM5_9BURK|nr:ABC transporter permease [Paraburkholderia unamae]PVX86733.1 ribose transport system permease protein/putative xylitol transport system permease protein [Paraburkholderia unamae]CAG9274272.1 ribose ABC transporter membrane subunit [Paraburkholderia unamae]